MAQNPLHHSLSGIPWGRAEEWQRMTTALRRHTFPKDRWESARNTAADVRRELSSLFPILQQLCQRTCPWCPDPCCLNARLWFDPKDILFLHLTDQEIPSRQPCAHRNQTCSFLGHRGCRLHRLRRPFMCTWYVCPTQKAILSRDPDLPGEDVRKGIQRIKVLRQQLASESGAENIFLSGRLDNPSANLKSLTMER